MRVSFYVLGINKSMEPVSPAEWVSSRMLDSQGRYLSRPTIHDFELRFNMLNTCEIIYWMLAIFDVRDMGLRSRRSQCAWQHGSK